MGYFLYVCLIVLDSGQLGSEVLTFFQELGLETDYSKYVASVYIYMRTYCTVKQTDVDRINHSLPVSLSEVYTHNHRM